MRVRGFSCGDDVARGLPDLGLHAAAADGAGDGAIVADEHLGALERGDGAARVDDGGHGAAAALALQLHDLLVDVHEFDYWSGCIASQSAGTMGTGNKATTEQGGGRPQTAFGGAYPPHWGFQVKLLAFKGLTIEYLF